MTYIVSPPTPFVISVTLGADIPFTILRKDTDGNPLNWNASVFMLIDIDKTTPTTIDAVVSLDVAAIEIPSAVADLVKASTRWRLYMQTTTTVNNSTTTLTTPIAVGGFERDDGGPS